MTPQERQLVDQLFDRLARLERAPRDAEAERAIADGLAQAPHAVYALVQTVLVQEEALKRADARIRELSGEDDDAREGGGGFLDTMRNALGGGSARGSVPSVRANAANDGRWNTGGALASAAPAAQGTPGAAPGQGGSFLGTAAASAAGMVGGALLFSSISSLLGSKGAEAAGGQSAAASPWGGDNAAGSDLSRDAGAGDVGNDRSAGLLDDGSADFAEMDGGDFGDFGDVG